MNSSYNFAADSMRLANLRSSVRSKIAGKLNLDLSMTHDFYQFDESLNRRTADFNKNDNGIISPRLTSARLSTGFRMTGMPWDDPKTTEDSDIDSTELEEDLSGPGLKDPLKNMRNTLGNKRSWSSNVSISYTEECT